MGARPKDPQRGSAFALLAQIIGPTLTEAVMDKMGGQHVKIRKRFDLVWEEYMKDQLFYDNCTLEEGAAKLRCQKVTLKKLRATMPKTYSE